LFNFWLLDKNQTLLQIVIRFISKVTIIIQRRNAYRNMQLYYVTNFLTQWNIPWI